MSNPILDGHDPLAATESDLGDFLERASKREVVNILKSYTGFYDVFSEMLQNSLDALQLRANKQESGFEPKIWITIDISNSIVRVVDNGIGMTLDEFKFCLKPNSSFNKESDFRGHKGVGATFLAYGFSFLKLQSKRSDSELAAILRQGRQWAEDTSGSIPRPKFEGTSFAVPELADETSGTSVEVRIGTSGGERPKNLAWMGATTADQWLAVLRIKTPLGGIYLGAKPGYLPTVQVKVFAAEGTETRATAKAPEYFYPHEIANLKAQSLVDITKAIAKISGDPKTRFTRLGSEFKRLDCVWEIWGKADLLADNSEFETALTEEQKLLVERHDVVVYGTFLSSAKIWSAFNEDELKLRKGQKIISGGLQIASDSMPQGDSSIIPLTSTIGYQANSHVVVHFTDGNPDLGRKVFQPELKDLANTLAVRVVNIMKKHLQHMRPDTGARTITPDKELHEWRRAQEEHRDKNTITLEIDGEILAFISKPQQEQDVVALFHELIGFGVLKGFRIFATSQSDRYDSLFFMDYGLKSDLYFDKETNRLGITRSITLPYQTQPEVLEYKYSFDSLIDDFDKEVKFEKHIDLVVCWQIDKKFRERFYLQSLLVGDEGSSREIYGSTHQAFPIGSQQQPSFEVIVLEDLLNWMQNPNDEEARQSRIYHDS